MRHVTPPSRLTINTNLAVMTIAWILSSQSATGQVARVRLSATDANGEPVSNISIGEEFWLSTLLTDLRPLGEGVFSNYVDVTFDSALTSPVKNSLEYSEFYPNGVNSIDEIFVADGLLDEIGSFSVLDPPEPGENLQFRLKMRANTVGIADFVLDQPDDLPLNEFLVRGNDGPIPFSEVHYEGTSIRIVPEPTAAVLWILGVTMALLARRRSR